MIENLGSSREALRAIEYAPDDVKVFYRGEIERIKMKWEAKRKERDRQYMEKKRRKRTLLWISVVITGCIAIADWKPGYPYSMGGIIVGVSLTWGMIYALLYWIWRRLFGVVAMTPGEGAEDGTREGTVSGRFLRQRERTWR